MKNSAMPAPRISVGTMMWAKSVCGVKPARIHSTPPKIKKATVAIQRGSHTATFLPTIGVIKIASRPTGTSAMPALVPV